MLALTDHKTNRFRVLREEAGVFSFKTLGIFFGTIGAAVAAMSATLAMGFQYLGWDRDVPPSKVAIDVTSVSAEETTLGEYLERFGEKTRLQRCLELQWETQKLVDEGDSKPMQGSRDWLDACRRKKHLETLKLLVESLGLLETLALKPRRVTKPTQDIMKELMLWEGLVLFAEVESIGVTSETENVKADLVSPSGLKRIRDARAEIAIWRWYYNGRMLVERPSDRVSPLRELVGVQKPHATAPESHLVWAFFKSCNDFRIETPLKGESDGQWGWKYEGIEKLKRSKVALRFSVRDDEDELVEVWLDEEDGKTYACPQKKGAVLGGAEAQPG